LPKRSSFFGEKSWSWLTSHFSKIASRQASLLGVIQTIAKDEFANTFCWWIDSLTAVKSTSALALTRSKKYPQLAVFLK
jgi:hypothetical protein